MKSEELKNQEYKYGFTTNIENIRAPKGLSEETIKFISKIKKEPKWMLEWRLKDSREGFPRFRAEGPEAVGGVDQRRTARHRFREESTVSAEAEENCYQEEGRRNG